MLLMILTEKKLLELFTKTNFNKKNPKKISIEKVIKRRDDKLYVKYKGYNNNSWIDKRDIV